MGNVLLETNATRSKKLRNAPPTWEDEDVAISVMRSFFRRHREGQFPDLKDRTELWPLLVTTTIWKANKLRKRQFAGKRDVRRNKSLEVLAENEPTAELAAQVITESQELLAFLKDEKLALSCGFETRRAYQCGDCRGNQSFEKTVEWRLRQVRKVFQERNGQN
ncbi:MAG: ECF-type sigma factor [Pirellulaceae bacterium]